MPVVEAREAGIWSRRSPVVASVPGRSWCCPIHVHHRAKPDRRARRQHRCRRVRERASWTPRPDVYGASFADLYARGRLRRPDPQGHEARRAPVEQPTKVSWSSTSGLPGPRLAIPPRCFPADQAWSDRAPPRPLDGPHPPSEATRVVDGLERVTETMVTWTEFAAAEPELATSAARRSSVRVELPSWPPCEDARASTRVPVSGTALRARHPRPEGATSPARRHARSRGSEPGCSSGIRRCATG